MKLNTIDCPACGEPLELTATLGAVNDDDQVPVTVRLTDEAFEHVHAHQAEPA